MSSTMRTRPQLLAALVLAVAFVISAAPANAQDIAPAAVDAALDIAQVDSPEINCRFTTTCIWYVEEDFIDEIPLAGTNGKGRLQTRTFAAGDAGTEGARLYPYLYKFNFFELAVTGSPVECIEEFTLPFGKVAPVDYDKDGEPDDIFVISGSSAAPFLASATSSATGDVTFTLTSPFCPSTPGFESGSYFIGLASTQPKMTLPAQIAVGGGTHYAVNALVPATTLVQLPLVTSN